LLIFNKYGELKVNAIFFKRYHPDRKAGCTYNIMGKMLVQGTYYHFELQKGLYAEIIEIL
jgi:hypothetical protein